MGRKAGAGCILSEVAGGGIRGGRLSTVRRDGIRLSAAFTPTAFPYRSGNRMEPLLLLLRRRLPYQSAEPPGSVGHCIRNALGAF